MRGERKSGPVEYPEIYARNARRMVQRFVDERGSQGAAAKELGISQSRISKILTGLEQPKLSLLISLRSRLQVPLDIMLGLPLLNADEELARKVRQIHTSADGNSVTHQVPRPPRK